MLFTQRWISWQPVIHLDCVIRKITFLVKQRKEISQSSYVKRRSRTKSSNSCELLLTHTATKWGQDIDKWSVVLHGWLATNWRRCDFEELDIQHCVKSWSRWAIRMNISNTEAWLMPLTKWSFISAVPVPCGGAHSVFHKWICLQMDMIH